MIREMIENLNFLLESCNIRATCINAYRHRHFSFYDLVLDHGALISSISRKARELSLALKTKTPFILDVIPEKGIVRMRTTHASPEKITVSDLYNQYEHTKPEGILPFLIGETDEGKPLWMDMAKNPHLLVAGATGSGKSVALHNLIENACRRDDVRLTLIDTKLVEFGVYRNSPVSHRMRYLAQDYSSALIVLERLELMMNKTYAYMAKHGIQSIEDAPDIFEKQLVIIDEAADLMLYDKKVKAFETLVISLAQKARAAGIYLVLATQRPSVDVLTGLIKSNFPARLACRVSTRVDSRVILDQQGAEHLTGQGDAMLKLPTGETTRLQIGYAEPRTTINRLEGTY